MNVVVDTNVVVSAAILPASITRAAVEFIRTHGELLFSALTIAEADKVLRRPRFNRYCSEKDRLDFLALLVDGRREVDIAHRVTACRDPGDDKFLEVAVNGNATHIVSGDLDLLALHPFRGIPILTPADFLTAVGAHP